MLSATDIRSFCNLRDRATISRQINRCCTTFGMFSPTASATMSAEEVQLLEAIGHHLPEDDLLRLNILRDRDRFGELSETEYQELIRYEDLLEEQRVKRLEALIELAKIRNIDLMQLNQQVGA